MSLPSSCYFEWRAVGHDAANAQGGEPEAYDASQWTIHRDDAFRRAGAMRESEPPYSTVYVERRKITASAPVRDTAGARVDTSVFVRNYCTACEADWHGQTCDRDTLEQITYVAVDALLSDEAIEAGGEAVRNLMGGDWIKYKGGEGVSSLAIKAAVNAVTGKERAT